MIKDIVVMFGLWIIYWLVLVGIVFVIFFYLCEVSVLFDMEFGVEG